MAIGLIDEWDAARTLSEVDAVFQPDEAAHAEAERSHARFVDLYARLGSWF